MSAIHAGVSNALKSIEKQIRICRFVHISWVSIVEGFPISGVPLYPV